MSYEAACSLNFKQQSIVGQKSQSQANIVHKLQNPDFSEENLSIRHTKQMVPDLNLWKITYIRNKTVYQENKTL